MKTQDAKLIPIIDFLAKIGHNPKTTRGIDFWYLSPFRREDTPSLKVDTFQNIWYDHGSKQGGSIIDLVMILYNFTIIEALQELNNFYHSGKYSLIQSSVDNKEFKPQDNIEYTIQSIHPLNNQVLIYYLKLRNINIDIAKHYLKEVHYIIDGKKFFALGFKNDSNGYELRSKYYKGTLKGCVKDVTTIKQQQESDTLLIFEGFIDFLSLFTVKNFVEYKDLTQDVVVLNTISMLQKVTQIIKMSNYKEIHLYFDTDASGRDAVNKLMFAVDNVQIIDMSNIYNGKKDLNEFIMSP